MNKVQFTFRNSDDDQSYGDNENLDEVHRFLVGSSAKVLLVRNNPLIHILITYRLGILAKLMKNLIMRAVKRIRPASAPSLAMSSAKAFNLACRGVISASPRRAARKIRLCV